MITLKFKHVVSAVATLAILTMVFSSVFADVTSVARIHHGGGNSFVAFVNALGL